MWGCQFDPGPGLSMKSKYLLIFIIFLALAVAVFFYIESNNSQLPKSSLEKEGVKVENSQLARLEIIHDVVEKINKISPVEPVLGGSWHITRFWFVQDSNKDFYVEYEDGHILRQILLEAEKKNKDEIEYKVVGYFEPGETNWILKAGTNPFLGKSLDLFEYSQELGKWIKKN